MTDNLSLTGDDLSRARSGIGSLITWWRAQGRSKYASGEIAKLNATLAKLRAIDQRAYPFESGYSEIIALPDFGGEPIMKLDARVVSETRKAAAKYNAQCPRPLSPGWKRPPHVPKPKRRAKP